MKQSRQMIADTEALVDASLATQGNNAVLHQRMGQILFFLAELYPMTVDRPSTEPMTSIFVDSSKLTPEVKAAFQKRSEYYTRAYAELEQATKLVKPEDPQYAEVCTFYAKQLERPSGMVKMDITREELEATVKNAHKRAEEVYREVIKNAPAERRVRIMLAEFIGREANRREEAIAILAEPTPPNPRWIGVRAAQAKYTEIELLNALCDLRLGVIENKNTPADKPARDTMIQQVQADYDKMVAMIGESSPQALQIKGRIQLTKGDAVGAAQTFNRALSLFSKSMDDRYALYELQYYLARTYLATQQTGEARKLFRSIVAMNPAHVGARLQLAELLMSEGNIKGTPPRFEDGAITQIDAAAPLLPPNNPVIARLRLIAADRSKDTKRFDEMWSKIPEGTAVERFSKASLANQLKKPEESIRLLELVWAENPGKADVATPLWQLYMTKGDKAKAESVVKEAVAKNPDNAGLKRMLEATVNPEGLQEGRLKDIEAIKDDLQRNLLLADYYRATGDEQKAFAALIEAEKLAPDNGRIMAAMFDQYIRRKEFDKAGLYLEKLAKRNEDNADGQIFRIRYALAQGKYQEANDQAVKLTQIRGEFAQAWVLLGQTLQALSRFDEAINSYQQAQERQTGNFDAIRGLVETYLATNRPGKRSDEALGQKATDARQYLELGLRYFPNTPYFKDNMLRWEILYGDPQKAIESRAAAVKDRPESEEAWMDLGMVYLTAAQPKKAEGATGSTPPPPSVSDEQAKQFLIKARDTFTQALAKFPEQVRFMQSLVETHLLLKEIDQAEKVITTFVAQEKYKNLPDSTAALADFYERASLPDKGEKVLRDALAKTPDNITFELRLANLLRGQGKVDEALKVLDANPDAPLVARFRVETLVRANRLEDASKYIDTRLAKEPNSDFYQRIRANVDFSLGRLDAVRAAAKKILDANPNDLDGLYLRARATMADPNGDINAAINDMIRVVNMEPKSVDARLQLAGAYWRRGVFDEAVRALEAAVGLTPNDKTLRLQLLNYYISSRPARWLDAEQFLKQTRSIPQFSNDVDLIHAEAQMWVGRKDPSKALNLIRDALKQNPESIAFLHTFFVILNDNKDYGTLITETDKSLKAKPDLWWAYQFRGLGKIGRNDRAGGLADLKTAMNGAIKANDAASVEAIARTIAEKLGMPAAREALTPLAEKDPHWQLVLANMLFNPGNDPAGALPLVEKVLTVANLQRGDLEVALKLAGVLYMNTSPPNVAKAIECYEKLLKDVPNDTNVLNNLAYLLLEPGPTYNPTKALVHSQRVLDLTIAQDDQASLPLVMDTHAWALINSGRVDDGIVMLRDALAKKRFVDGFYHLGEAFLRKQPPDLIEAYREFDNGRVFIEDAVRAQQPVDPNMKAKIQASLDRVKQMRK
ncbi:MAG: tetratricopeptide repeat protein [Anaerolineae bacterium]|nr:tetratricopeptide repeat protein [Phycisphaerae bacterium]